MAEAIEAVAEVRSLHSIVNFPFAIKMNINVCVRVYVWMFMNVNVF